jgi:CRISPR-associated protein Cas2
VIVVIILDRVPASVRGDLSRWMIEPRAGVFVGHVTAQVRDRLWDRISARVREGASLMVYEDVRAEQGVSFRQVGERARELVDLDGLTLVRLPLPAAREAAGP